MTEAHYFWEYVLFDFLIEGNSAGMCQDFIPHFLCFQFLNFAGSHMQRTKQSHGEVGDCTFQMVGPIVSNKTQRAAEDKNGDVTNILIFCGGGT